MAGALARYGQLSPVAVFLQDDAIEVLDGIKRLAAARAIPGFSELQSRRLSLNEREAKAAILTLKRPGIGCRPDYRLMRHCPRLKSARIFLDNRLPAAKMSQLRLVRFA
jgi:hypothetical protein